MKKNVQGLMFGVLLGLLPVLSLWAAGPSRIEVGRDYVEVSSPNPVVKRPKQSNQVEVLEFFSYGCPWCYRLEPDLAAWVKKNADRIRFRRVPVIFEDRWEVYARAYHIAQAFGKAQTLNVPLFEAIQVRREELSDKEALKQFFISQGITAEQFEDAYASPSLDLAIAEDNALANEYQIDRVPTLVISGKYKTDIGMTDGDNVRFLSVLDYLIAKQSRKTIKK